MGKYRIMDKKVKAVMKVKGEKTEKGMKKVEVKVKKEVKK